MKKIPYVKTHINLYFIAVSSCFLAFTGVYLEIVSMVDLGCCSIMQFCQPFSSDFTLYLLKVMSRLQSENLAGQSLALKGGVTMSILDYLCDYHFLLASLRP